MVLKFQPLTKYEVITGSLEWAGLVEAKAPDCLLSDDKLLHFACYGDWKLLHEHHVVRNLNVRNLQEPDRRHCKACAHDTFSVTYDSKVRVLLQTL